MKKDKQQGRSHRGLEDGLGGLQLDTPPVENGDVQDYVNDKLDASRFAQKLGSQWRSLLDESSALDTLGEGSLMFRPRAEIGLEPDSAVGLQSCRAGEVLDDFELLRLVAQGGMGQVWEARQQRLDRLVALKLIRPDRMTAEALTFFKREGRAAGRLRHPSIVAIHAMGESNDVHWIAQEFIDGECTLADFLKDVDSAKRLPSNYDRRIALFFFQLAEGLAYAHDQNVTHRDLKPQNVLIAEGDRPKLTDFGLARLEEEAANEGSGLLGTPRYMSPEQATGSAQGLGRASDTFSLGTMLYQALTLKFPFDGKALDEILDAICNSEPIPCRAHRSTIAPDLAAIVWKAMRKEPAQRYAHMRDMAADLAAYLDGRPVLARPVGLTELARKFVRRNTKEVGIATAVLLVGSLMIGAAGYYVTEAAELAQETLYDKHLVDARVAILGGDSELAFASLDAASQLLPERPERHVMLAGAFARWGDRSRAQAEIRAAERLGFDFETADNDNAQEQYALGLHRLVSGKTSDYEGAQTAFERAIEIDDGQTASWFHLHIIHALEGDHEASYDALVQYQRGLLFGDAHQRLIDALKLERSGKFDEARDALAELGNDPTVKATRLEQLRFNYFYGRLLLRAGDYELARDRLELAHASSPYNADPVGILAAAAFLAGRQTSDAHRRHQLYERAAEAAELSIQFTRHDDIRAELQLLLYIAKKLHDENPDPDRLATALSRLREFDPNDPVALATIANRHVARGVTLWERGEQTLAAEELESALELDRERLTPFVLLGQAYGMGDTPLDLDRAAELLDEGFTLWGATDAQAEKKWTINFPHSDLSRPLMVQALLATRFLVAILREDYEVAHETRAALEDYVASGHPFELPHTELLTFAEALVIAADPDERDPERARELYEEFLLSSGFEPGGWPAGYNSTMQAILDGIATPKK